jgi:hypothetical protein
MAKPSKAVLEFMERYKIDSDEIWEVHGSTWVVKHKALERVAAEVGITFDRPSVITCDLANKIACICVFGKLGERSEWSFGEATPANNKNAYAMAMCEKRAKDRVILKLLTTHGALYSESEADDFTQPRQNPHVTRPEDIHEEFTDDIPGEASGKRMLVKNARPEYAELVKEMQRIQDPAELQEWGAARADLINSLPGSWPKNFRGEYATHKRAITNGKAA